MSALVHLRRFVVDLVEQLRRPASLGTVDGVEGSSATLTTEDANERLVARLLQQYGFASRPPAGSPAVGVFRAGQTSGALVIATAAAEYSVGLEDGEVALYHPAGSSVLLTQDGDVVVTPKAGRTVQLGGPDGQAGVLGADLIAWINDTLLPWCRTHTNPEGAVPPEAAALTDAPDSLLSEKVESE